MYRFYSRHEESNPVRVTVVGTYTEGVLKLAVARCSDKDRFVRKYGRARAESRLQKGHLYREMNLNKPDLSPKEFLDIAEAAAEEVKATLKVYGKAEWTPERKRPKTITAGAKEARVIDMTKKDEENFAKLNPDE